MKISYRILVINFAVVVAILASSAVAIYSVMFNAVSSQQSKHLVNSANNFMFSYRSILQDSEDEFIYYSGKNFIDLPDNLKDNDFILTCNPENPSLLKVKYAADECNVPDKPSFLISDFLDSNPYTVVKSFKSGNCIYYYGRIINENLLNLVSQRIGSDIALIRENMVVEVSNSIKNKDNFNLINQAYSELVKNKDLNTFTLSSDDEDIVAAKCILDTESELNKTFHFVVFTKLTAAADFKSTLLNITLLIGLTGVILSLILTMIFTDKIRKQIKNLNNATEVIKKGNFTQKINVESNDELGQLGDAFNAMLDVLAKNEQTKNEYSEFITLINRNPSLSEISEAALSKIINACGYTIGALYIVENDEFVMSASYGIDKDFIINRDSGLFKTVVSKREILEVNIEENYPQLVSGFVNLKIKNVLILPVIYNNKVIAVIELGAVSKPAESAKDYISRIQEQLAVGLTNAMAFVQLENFVTELKNLNEEYQKQNLQIKKQNETLVNLHKELKEKADELVIQKQKAEESTQLKSQFLASMSHELRTPMNSILGLTELILEEPVVAGKNRERLEVVLKSGKRLMNLINDILDLSKIEAGKMEIHEEELLLEEIISDVETSVIPLVKNKNISFTVNRLVNTKMMVTADHGKLMQILINLLGNAVKFTEKGSVFLNVSSPANNILQFDIKDTGIGISEQDQKIIFEEFRQADGTSTKKFSGTGLGLAITGRIVNLMKGSISLISSPGEGSTFTVQIPLKKSAAVLPELNQSFGLDSLVKNINNPVLVIDDDEDIRFTIGHYLNSKGYDVVFAENGSEGIRKAVELQPFAITLDLMMPEKDGWTTLKELKGNPLTKDIPVILISILGDPKVGYGLGAFEYFIKPIRQEELLSALGKLENLARRRIQKIVIVDDDELEFEKFRKEFKQENIRIDYVKDSELAFSKILETQPDLVIADLFMPGVDGITLSHKLKLNKETRHIPIIISSAKDLSENEKNTLLNVVENITVKSKGHPLDVLKVVRDRIRMQEMYAAGTEPEIVIPLGLKSTDKNPVPEYLEVLIVDDDPDALYTINEIVQACDCKTILAKGGAECLGILEEKNPDLILLDIMMPEMDGFQTLKKIRESKKFGNIPVYAVTAKAMLEDKAVIMKQGFNDYLFKPVNAGILAFKLRKLLSVLRVNQ